MSNILTAPAILIVWRRKRAHKSTIRALCVNKEDAHEGAVTQDWKMEEVRGYSRKALASRSSRLVMRGILVKDSIDIKGAYTVLE